MAKDYYYYSEFSTVEEIYDIIPAKSLTPYRKGKETRYYISYPATFDIETTTILDEENSTAENKKYIGFMYHWQFAIPKNSSNPKDFLVILGRRWEEFTELLDILKRKYLLNKSRRLVVYVHGLFFEFQFIHNFIAIESVFARKKRNPIKVECNDAFEFRCSFTLSNMSLSKFISNTPGAIYGKLSGKDYDYSKLRTPDTLLSDLEIEYCCNDVRGLLEAILHLLAEDDLSTIPLTSTGYVRRDVRSAVQKNPDNRKQMLEMKLTPILYALCHEGFRGGNSNSNAYLANQILNGVKSFDRKSSYPAELMVDLFPVTPFMPITPDVSTVESYIGEYAILMQVVLFDLDAIDRCTIPYIAVSKCEALGGHRDNGTLVIANGRLIKADYAAMVITDVDYKIIKEHYTFDMYVNLAYVAKYGHVNNEFRRNLLNMFIEKTKLERGDPYLYSKFKNRINAYFGMFVTDICSPEIIFEGEWKEEQHVNVEAKLSKYYNSRSSFLNYQQGIWVTANARYRHQQGIDACDCDIVMGDTDSCKFIGDHEDDFKRLNQEWLSLCENNDIVPIVQVWEKPTVMGIWEQEYTCSEYITLGAKKHAYIKEGETKCRITVAGLNKEDGAKWLTENGGLNNFKIGVTIPEKSAGRTVAYYNDCEYPYTMTVDGCTFTTASNIAVVNTTYTIGISDDYLSYLIGITDERASFDGTYSDIDDIFESIGEEDDYERSNISNR